MLALLSKTILYGSAVEKNSLPSVGGKASIRFSGTHNGNAASISLDSDILSKHSLLIGGTGCGKTTLFYHFISQIKKCMTSNDVMIIFDSKGDFHKHFWKSGDSVIGTSPVYAKTSEKWNVYREILADGWEESKYKLNTQEICKSFFSSRNNSQNPFFPNAARDLLAAIICQFIKGGVNDKTLAKEWFYNNKLKEFLDSHNAEEIVYTLSFFPEFHSVISYISEEGPQTQGVMSEMFSVVNDIFVSVFSDKGKFSIRDFVRNKGGKTLFIEYDLSMGNVLSPIYTLLLDLALKEALGRQRSEGNVYLFCDEFKLLPKLEHIADGVNFGRSLGVKIFAGLQSIEQLYENYGQEKGRNIAAGFSSVYAFKANDSQTRKYVKELFGQNLVLEQYKTFDNKIVEEKRSGFTVEDWDLSSLKVGEAVVGLPFEKPFRFYFNPFK